MGRLTRWKDMGSEGNSGGKVEMRETWMGGRRVWRLDPGNTREKNGK